MIVLSQSQKIDAITLPFLLASLNLRVDCDSFFSTQESSKKDYDK